MGAGGSVVVDVLVVDVLVVDVIVVVVVDEVVVEEELVVDDVVEVVVVGGAVVVADGRSVELVDDAGPLTVSSAGFPQAGRAPRRTTMSGAIRSMKLTCQARPGRGSAAPSFSSCGERSETEKNGTSETGRMTP